MDDYAYPESAPQLHHFPKEKWERVKVRWGYRYVYRGLSYESDFDRYSADMRAYMARRHEWQQKHPPRKAWWPATCRPLTKRC